MKQIHYIIASLFTLLSISSCEVESGTDVTNQRTLAGKYVFDEVKDMLYSYISILGDALEFDAYLQADEKEQERILKYLLRGYKFSEKGDTLCFETKEHEWRIVRESTDSISTPSASWSMGFISKNDGVRTETLPLGGLIFTRNAQGDAWLMEANERDGSVMGEGSFEIKKLTNYELHPSRSKDEYTITTVDSTFAFLNGRHSSVSPLRVKYQITKPFYRKKVESNSSIYFIEGRVEMDLIGSGYSEEKDHVSAEIEQSNYESVTIRYRGITELLPQGYTGYENVYGGGY